MHAHRSRSDARGRTFLFVVGGIAALAGALMASIPALVAASALAPATPHALLATRELGLALAAIGALLASIGRSGSAALRCTAIGVMGTLSALLALNHVNRTATESERLFAPAHSYGEIAALALLSAIAFGLVLRMKGEDAPRA